MMILLYLFYSIVSVPIVYFLNLYGFILIILLFNDGSPVCILWGLMLTVFISLIDILIIQLWKTAIFCAIGKRRIYTE